MSTRIPPTDEWLERGAAFFGPSIDLSRVTVRTSRLVWGGAGTAWTCNDVVRFKRPLVADDLRPNEATMIHELAHVWQHQSGQAQLLRGMWEQLGRRVLGRDPYDYGGPDGVARAEALTRFAKEAQARIIEEHWRSRNGFATDRDGVPFSRPGYTTDLERLVRDAGIGGASVPRRTAWSAVDGVAARIVNAVAALVDRWTVR